MNFLRKRPWLIVAAAFLGFVVWWAWFIVLAVRNQPAEVPLVSSPFEGHADH